MTQQKGTEGRQQKPRRRQPNGMWQIALFVGIVVVVVGIGIFTVIGPDLSVDVTKREPARPIDVSITSISKTEFAEKVHFVYIDVNYEPASVKAPLVACSADNGAGVVVNGQTTAWGDLGEGVVRKSVPLAKAPDGEYVITCKSGETSAQATVDVVHNLDFVVEWLLAGRFQIPTFILSKDAPPHRVEDTLLRVTFTAYASGRLDRQSEGVNEPVVFQRHEDGSYIGEAKGVGDLVRQVITLVIQSDTDVLTTIDSYFSNGRVERTSAVWRKVSS